MEGARESLPLARRYDSSLVWSNDRPELDIEPGRVIPIEWFGKFLHLDYKMDNNRGTDPARC